MIYKITNLVNHKYYIGVTNGKNPRYKGSGTALKEAIKHYGSINFKKEILEVFDTAEEAFSREAELVDDEFVQNRDTYNIKVGGKGGTGQLKTQEHRKKISDSVRKNYRVGKVKNCGGRKPIMDLQEIVSIVEEYGIKSAAEKLKLTYHQCRDRYYRAKNKLKVD